MTPQDFSDRALMFGIQDAALALRIEGAEIDVAQAIMRHAMRGMRIQFYPREQVFQWLPVPIWAKR